MNRIKHIIVIWLLLVLITACSDYPTSGRISFDKLEAMAKEEFIVNSIETEGFIFEFEEDIFDRIKKFDKRIHKLKQFTDNPSKAKSYKQDFSDDDVDSAIDAFFSQRKEYVNKVKNIVEQDKQNKLEEFKNQQQVVEKLQQTQDLISQYTQKPQQTIESIDAKIKKAQEEMNKILDNIVKKTNEVIVAEKLPVKKLTGNYFNLSSQELTMNAKATTCEHYSDSRHYNRYRNYNSKRYVILDEIKSHGRCTYIQRPSQEVQTPAYDEYVAKEFIKTRKWDKKTLKKQLKIAKQELKKAQIIAENQTNIKIYQFNRKFENAKRKMKNLKEATQQVNIEEMVQSLGLAPLEEGQKSSNKYGYMSPFSDILSKARELKPSAYDIDTNFDQAIQIYRNKSLYEIFDDATKEVTEINSDGTFSGLDGSFGYLVPIILMDVEIELDGRSKSEKGVFTDVIHIKSEKSKLAQMDEILLDPSKGRMQRSKKYKKEGYKSVLFTTLLLHR